MSLERRTALQKGVEAAGIVAAFWYLSRLLLSARVHKQPVDKSKLITWDNVDTLQVDSERDAALALLQALPPGTKIRHEPIRVELSLDESEQIKPWDKEGNRIDPYSHVPDFATEGVVIEVSYAEPDHPRKQKQAKVMETANFKNYAQICGEALVRLVTSDNKAQELYRATNGLLGSAD